MENWVQAIQEVSRKSGNLSAALETWQDTKSSVDAHHILYDCDDLDYDLRVMERSMMAHVDNQQIIDDLRLKKDHIKQVVSEWLQHHSYEPLHVPGIRNSS